MRFLGFRGWGGHDEGLCTAAHLTKNAWGMSGLSGLAPEAH